MYQQGSNPAIQITICSEYVLFTSTQLNTSDVKCVCV